MFRQVDFRPKLNDQALQGIKTIITFSGQETPPNGRHPSTGMAIRWHLPDTLSLFA